MLKQGKETVLLRKLQHFLVGCVLTTSGRPLLYRNIEDGKAQSVRGRLK